MLRVEGFINQKSEYFRIDKVFFWLENWSQGKGDCVTLGKSCDYLVVDPGSTSNPLPSAYRAVFRFPLPTFIPTSLHQLNNELYGKESRDM